MKKIISAILCISLLVSILCVPVSATTEEKRSSDISGFINGINELTQKYDADKDFEVTSDNIQSESISDDASLYYSASSVSENETRDEPELDFQTCRLIVQSNYSINTYNAVDVVSGFSNFYIFQYANESDTEKAYKNYIKDTNILSVNIDVVVSVDNSNFLGRGDEEVVYTKEDFNNDWSLYATGMDSVLKHYEKAIFPEVVIGVLDSGIDLDHEVFENRIVRTYYNSSGDGDPKDESDVFGHGTAVASIIVRATPQNVKVAMYRNGTDNGVSTTASACAGILKIISDGIKLINCSFLLFTDFELQKATLEYAEKNNVFISQGAGNTGQNLDYRASNEFNTNPFCFVSGSSNKYNYPSFFTEFGTDVDIMAPAESVCYAECGGGYHIGSGTSFAAPYVAAVYALLTSIYPNKTLEEKSRLIEGTGIKIDEPYTDGYFGGGILNALKIFDIDVVQCPKFNIDGGVYVGPLSIELTAESDCDIYFTTDQTYPSPSNGILYTEPIEFEGAFFEIKAIAYKNGHRSSFISDKFYSAELGTDDMFTISDDGIITGYDNSSYFLKVPEIINGITVTDIAEGVFKESTNLYGLILPDTMEYLGDASIKGVANQKSCISGNTTVTYVEGKNIKILGEEALANCTNVKEVNFPSAETICANAFNTCSVVGLNLPSVKELLMYAFNYAHRVREIYLPECEFFFDSSFYNCRLLHILYAPKLDFQTQPIEFPDLSIDISVDGGDMVFVNLLSITTLNLPSVRVLGYTRGFIPSYFENSTIRRLELSNIEYLYELPTPGSKYCLYYLPLTVELVLPSTLKYCEPTTNFINEEERSYVVYGTEGTYAQDWAEVNNVPFYPISQSTAIVEDVEPIWDKYSYKPLVFDARGFNRTYQWYGSYDNKIGNDVAINGATTNEFDPGENCKYAYYYCQMTSTDIDNDGNIVSSFTVNSTLSQNRFYYMYAKDKTKIDYDNHLIFSNLYAQKDMSQIVGIPESTNYYTIPSMVYKNYYWYGTGSSLLIYHNGGTREEFTLIVQGDVNGDSAVDVLDAAYVELVTSGHKQLTDAYFLAADTNSDEEITVEDYAQVVNLVLAG